MYSCLCSSSCSKSNPRLLSKEICFFVSVFCLFVCLCAFCFFKESEKLKLTVLKVTLRGTLLTFTTAFDSIVNLKHIFPFQYRQPV